MIKNNNSSRIKRWLKQSELNKKRLLFLLIIFLICLIGSSLIYYISPPFSKPSAISLSLGEMFNFGIIYFTLTLYLTSYRSKKVLLIGIVFSILIFGITYFVRQRILRQEFALLYLSSWLVLLIIYKINPKVLLSLGFNFKKPIISIILAGLASIILMGHLIFTVSLTTKFYFTIPPNFIYWFLHSISLNSVGEEIFYRGFLFQQFQKLGIPLNKAVIFSSLLYTAKYASSPYLILDAALIWGTIFYIFCAGIISCLLLHFNKSLLAPILFNILFQTMGNCLNY